MQQNFLTGFEDGFGESSAAELEELRKALDIGYSQPVTGVGHDALRVESLEGTLKVLTYAQTELRLWNQIPKLNATSTVEEYNRLREYGSEAGGFVASGVLPEEEDTIYERADQKVKYLGSTRVVNHPSTLVTTVPADLIAQETSNGALWIMKKANRGLYYGDSSVIPLEWNGISNQIQTGSGLVYDLRGQPLVENDIENMVQDVSDNFGNAQRFFSNGKVFSDFSKIYHNRQRQSPGQGGDGGTPMTGFNTINGRISFEPDVFVVRGGAGPATGTSPKAPSAPSVAAGAATGTGSQFTAADAGDYIYQVSAVNQYGESPLSTATSAVTVAAGQSVPLTVTDGGGTYEATGYKLYRTEKDGTTTYWTNLTVARAQVGGVPQATTPISDSNAWLPRTFIGLLLDMSNQSLSFKQLSPMIKMPLATIAPSIRWMQLLYGTPIIYAPRKNVFVKNIGVAT